MMLTLLRKELNSFLDSLIGYMVMSIFLLLTGLFLWVFPDTEFNILDNGYANVDGLFVLAPWVFMLLVPAVCMRSFAEERKTGTMELLLTKPLSDMQIILAKFFAGVVLVAFSLIPTFLYFVSVYLLGDPVGNIDYGGFWGSMIGLLLLGSGFVSIGIFASALSSSQVIAFVLAVFLCFFWYLGFDSVSAIPVLHKLDFYIQFAGISAHYKSLSRGVIDTRDVVYFISLIALFLYITRLSLESRKW